MKILVLGGDGRAHSLVWKLFNSPSVDTIICAPGNAGTSQIVPSVDGLGAEPAAIARWAFDHAIDLILPTSSVPLQQGIVDEAVAFGVNVFGPSQRSALLERSRCAAKSFMLRNNLPTAAGRAFSDPAMAEKFLATQPMPVIIKADHPALREEVYSERYAAIAGLHQFFNAGLLHDGSAGVVIESYLRGPRVVFSAFTDGKSARSLLPVRLYDRVAEDDSGLQAPGIGAHTNISRYATLLGEFLDRTFVQPAVAGLAREGLPYWGILSLDCIITAEGPRLTALRTSFHEDEAEVVLPRLQDDLLRVVQAIIAQRLHELPALTFSPVASLGLGLIGRGHPHYSSTGGPINGVDDLDPGVLLFHNATESAGGQRGGVFGFGAKQNGLRVAGGHPLTLVTTGATLAGARGRALINAERIQFEGRIYRSSVGEREFA